WRPARLSPRCPCATAPPCPRHYRKGHRRRKRRAAYRRAALAGDTALCQPCQQFRHRRTFTWRRRRNLCQAEAAGTMTPFGEEMRRLRRLRGITQKQMAAAIGVSPAYLSALEHGRRGMPSWALLQKIIGYLNIIWDEADQLQRLAMLSHPRVTIDTEMLSPKATELANLLARRIGELDEDRITRLIGLIEER